MKESKLIEMQNKIKSLNAAVQHLVTLSVGTAELIKHMPDYDEALKKMKENEANK
jgi:predicted ATP-grasp superfamily ATP-dependent carboligase|tara:strand:+ start:764 stop:928 length:165 start_codon:yes stop_codon:yes gene_type:complete